MKSICIRSYSGPYFPTFGLNADQSNSEYGYFLRSGLVSGLNFMSVLYLVPKLKLSKSEVYSLHEKCPDTEFYLVRILLYSVRVQKNTD